MLDTPIGFLYNVVIQSENNMITKELTAKVDAKLKWCQDVIQNKFGVYVHIACIKYDLDGTTGGLADYTRKTIHFHPIFLKNHTQDYIEQTVVHEFAHLANDVLFPHDLSLARGNRKSHGKNWKRLMEVLGAKPRIKHNYSIEHIQAKKNYRNYMCTCCNTDIKLSQVRHRRVMKGVQYLHGKCNAPIIFVGP